MCPRRRGRARTRPLSSASPSRTRTAGSKTARHQKFSSGSTRRTRTPTACSAVSPRARQSPGAYRTLATTSSDRSSPQISGTTLFYLRETPPAPQPVLVAETWPPSPNGPAGSERTLVDVNVSGASDGTTAIADYWPSPSGRYVAYGTAEGGSELTTIRFRDVKSGATLPDALRFAGGGTSPQALAPGTPTSEASSTRAIRSRTRTSP